MTFIVNLHAMFLSDYALFSQWKSPVQLIDFNIKQATCLWPSTISFEAYADRDIIYTSPPYDHISTYILDRIPFGGRLTKQCMASDDVPNERAYNHFNMTGNYNTVDLILILYCSYWTQWDQR